MREVIFHNPLLVLALVVALGLLLGRVQVAGMSLGSSGVLFTALLAGHLGMSTYAGVGTLGLIVFVYCVGIGAGGRFFAALAREGSLLAWLALLIVGLGSVTVWLLGSFAGIPADLATGIFAGALTSTPALAAAIDYLGPESAAVSIGYGISYPFGVIGVVLFVQLLPRLLGVDLQKEGTQLDARDSREEQIVACAVEVTNPEIAGAQIGEFAALTALGCQVTRVRQGDRFVPLQYNDTFRHGDELMLVGRERFLDSGVKLIGRRVDRELVFDAQRERRQLIVTRKDFGGKPLRDLHLLREYGVVVSRVSRVGITFVPNADTTLERNDVLTTVGDPDSLDRFAEAVGHRSQAFDQTDLLGLAVGLFLGVFLGLLTIGLPGGGSFSLGLAGGPLFAGLILGHLGKVGGIIGHIPRPTRMLLQETGLVLFLADAGIKGGEAFVDTLHTYGASLFLVGVAVTVVPTLVAFLVARFLMRMNVLQALGGICGGMTSTPALGAITAKTDSQGPVVSYATAYPVAMILMTVFAQMLLQIMGH